MSGDREKGQEMSRPGVPRHGAGGETQAGRERAWGAFALSRLGCQEEQAVPGL